MHGSELPTAPVSLNAYEIGFLTVFLLARPREDQIAREIYFKLKAAAIAVGVEWYYDDPKEWK